MVKIKATLETQFGGSAGSTIRHVTSIVSGRDATLHGPIMVQPGRAVRANRGGVFATWGNSSITFDEFVGFLEWVDQAPEHHRAIIRNRTWLNIYGAEVMSWPTNFGTTIHEISVGCQYCGIILPMRAIQVDHTRPQAADSTESVAKVFRHFNLTQGAAHGFKARFIGGHQPDDLGKDERYTLNEQGAIIYSLIHAGRQDEVNSLHKSCRNHIANLRPLCGPCNSGRNKGGGPFMY